MLKPLYHSLYYHALTIHNHYATNANIDTEAVLPPLASELLEAGDEVAALDLVEFDMFFLLSSNIQCDVEAETIAGLGINGGEPLYYVEWMNALVDQEVAALPESDPVINAIVRDLLVSCRCFVWCTGVFLFLFYSRDDIRSYATTFHYSLILLFAIIYLIHHRVPGK